MKVLRCSGVEGSSLANQLESDLGNRAKYRGQGGQLLYSVVSIALALSVMGVSEPASRPSGGGAPSAAPSSVDAKVDGAGEVAMVGLPVAGALVRVGGDVNAAASRKGSGESVKFVCAGVNEIDTALPVGYPEPTPPGAIDLKNYPSVRRAVVEGEVKKNGDAGGDGFWPLFRHIQRRDIAMTSPVEMEYSAEEPKPSKEGGPAEGQAEKNQATERWTMAFLYRRADQGAAGDDEADKRVKVMDEPPLLVISIGMKGNYSRELIDDGEKQLEKWLAGQQRFVRAGGTRALYYHGPSLRPWRKWAEVQIPVREVAVQKD
jgi:hypothetical protein